MDWDHPDARLSIKCEQNLQNCLRNKLDVSLTPFRAIFFSQHTRAQSSHALLLMKVDVGPLVKPNFLKKSSPRDST
jgi:hypothetical protein